MLEQRSLAAWESAFRMYLVPIPIWLLRFFWRMPSWLYVAWNTECRGYMTFKSWYIEFHGLKLQIDCGQMILKPWYLEFPGLKFQIGCGQMIFKSWYSEFPLLKFQIGCGQMICKSWYLEFPGLKFQIGCDIWGFSYFSAMKVRDNSHYN